jgi:F0F1-type ATP synthase assembly protein I
LVSNFKNKKGASLGYFEIIFVVVILFIVGAVWLVFDNFGSEINDFLLEDDDFLTHNDSRAVVEDMEERRSNTFDSMFILVVLGMFFLGGISAWYAGSNPIFMVITFLFIVMVLAVPIFLGDAWVDLTEDFDSSHMSFMTWVMNNYLLFSLVFVFVTLGIMYFKSRLDL